MRHGSHQRSLRIPILLWDFFSKIYSQRSQEMGTISRGFASLSRIYEKYGDATGEVVTLIGCKKIKHDEKYDEKIDEKYSDETGDEVLLIRCRKRNLMRN